MSTRSSRPVAAVVTALLVTATAACTSKSKSTASTTTAAGGSATTGGGSATTVANAIPTVTIPTVSKDAAVAAKVPAAIAAKGSITVALDGSYAPDEFVGPDGHTIVGLDADLATALGQAMGLKVTLVNATFDTIIPGLTSGKYDLGASSFTDTKAREQQVDFVTYFSSGEGYYEASNNKATYDGLEALCGIKVSVEAGTTEETDAKTQSTACTGKGKPAVQVLSYQDQNAANLAVSSGRAQIGFADSQVAAYIVSQSKGQFKLTGQPFSTAPYGLAVPKGSGLAAPLLDAVKSLQNSGIYTKILDRWGVASGALTSPVINGATS